MTMFVRFYCKLLKSVFHTKQFMATSPFRPSNSDQKRPPHSISFCFTFPDEEAHTESHQATDERLHGLVAAGAAQDR